MSDTDKKQQEEQENKDKVQESEKKAEGQEINDQDLDDVSGGKGGKTKW